MIKYLRFTYWLFFLSAFIPFIYLSSFVKLPSLFIWLPYIILFVAILTIIIVYPHHSFIRLFIKNKLVPKRIIIIGSMFFFVGILSTIYNKSSFIGMLFYFSWFFLMVSSIILTRIVFTKNDIKKTLKIFLLIGLLNFPISLLQRFILVNKMALDSPDIVTGLFNNYFDLAFYQIFCMLMVIVYWLYDRRILFISPFATLIALICPLILSNSKATWLYLFVCILFLFLTGIPRRKFQKGITLFFIFGFIFFLAIKTFDYFFSKHYSIDQYQSYRYIIDMTYLQEYIFGGNTYDSKFTKGKTLRRGVGILFAYDLISENPTNLILGLGPGHISMKRSPISNNTLHRLFVELDLYKSTLPIIIGGMGISGVLLLISLYCGMYFWKSNKNDYKNELNLLRKNIIFLSAILTIYYNILQSPVFYLIIGLLFFQDTSEK